MGLPSILVTTGFFLLLRSAFSSDPTVPQPISCLTRAADLKEDNLLVLCPAGCGQWRASVFGTGIYASVSSVCGAAIHRGVLGQGGGPVRLHRLQGRQRYVSSASNAVQSLPLAHWTASFSLSKPVHVPLELSSLPSTTALPAAQPVKKTAKKPTPKKVPTPGNRECQVDVAVVMDSSQNMGQRRFNLQKNFLAKLVSVMKVGVSGPHVGVVQAGDSPTTELYLSNITQPKELLQHIKQLPQRGGRSNTGQAIVHAVETLFLPEQGSRRGHPRVLLVLVDGWPSDSLAAAATRARDDGVNLFLVTVAKATAQELHHVNDKDFIKKAVCRDNGFFSYHIPSWFSSTKHVKALSHRLCSLDSLICSKTCYNSVNLGFLIDGSSSVGDGNFRLVLDFLSSVARSFDVSDLGARVGAVQFTYEQRLEFGMADHASQEGVADALRRISYMSGGTATGEAISYAAQHLFRRAGPGRNFLVVVTDGQSYDDVRGPAHIAHRQGISIFSVGVAWAPLDDLRAMASEPKERHTFFSREFSGLSDVVQPLVRGICQDFSDNN